MQEYILRVCNRSQQIIRFLWPIEEIISRWKKVRIKRTRISCLSLEMVEILALVGMSVSLVLPRFISHGIESLMTEERPIKTL